MRGQEIGLAGDGVAARIGDQGHMVAAPVQLFRQRERGDQVAPGAARGQHEMAPGLPHGTISRFSSTSPLARFSDQPMKSARPRVSRLRCGLRRVTASSKPTVKHTAMVDDPP